ncbi:hypothetical protein PTTG_06332, partial [Puccinia triticina 1-1 BBBD Race 1]
KAPVSNSEKMPPKPQQPVSKPSKPSKPISPSKKNKPTKQHKTHSPSPKAEHPSSELTSPDDADDEGFEDKSEYKVDSDQADCDDGQADFDDNQADFDYEPADADVEEMDNDNADHQQGRRSKEKEWFLPKLGDHYETYIDHGCTLDKQGYPIYPNGRTTF